MTEIQIQEGNKLIAEFMGWKFNAYPNLTHFNATKPEEKDWVYATYEEELFHNYVRDNFKYNCSWDWLMDACKKFSNFSRREDINGVLNWSEYLEYCDLIKSYITIFNIQGTFSSLIKGINWYNRHT